MIDLQALSDDDFAQLVTAVVAEQERRKALPHVEQAQAEVVKELQDAGKLPAPDALTDVDSLPDVGQIPAWVSPGTDHSAMYRFGDIIAHSGRVWQSKHNGLNHWEPGAPGVYGFVWQDITPELPAGDGAPSAPAYVDNRDYQAGDQVLFNDVVFECVAGHFAAPGWTPVNAHGMWKQVN